MQLSLTIESEVLAFEHFDLSSELSDARLGLRYPLSPGTD